MKGAAIIIRYSKYPLSPIYFWRLGITVISLFLVSRKKIYLCEFSHPIWAVHPTTFVVSGAF